MKYFIKLINNEKLEISFQNYLDYKNNVNDYMVVNSKNNIELIVKYNQIVLAYRLDTKPKETLEDYLNQCLIPKYKRK